jgi:hypothetical protein
MITWLGFRHVKYGVRPHHIPIMGQVGEFKLISWNRGLWPNTEHFINLLNYANIIRIISMSFQVLMSVLEKALARQWTESMANAWMELWQVIQSDKSLPSAISMPQVAVPDFPLDV